MQLRRSLVLVAMTLAVAVHPVFAGGFGGPSIATIAPLTVTHNAALDTGQRVALAVLAMDFNGVVHDASAGYYSNPWVRDSFAWGMIPSTDGASLQAYATTEISYWLARQQPFGGWLTAPKSGYFDETPIFISAVLDAYRLTHDRATVLTALPALERGWHWLAKSYIAPIHGSTALLYANVPPHVAADWVDQIARRGYATGLEALWYKATADLSTMEALAGKSGLAAYYAVFAARIKRDINRLLWTEAAPFVAHAPSVPAFGHYRSWIGPREYFEMDSNFLCILYGIATPAQARSIIDFVHQHAGYLLGLQSPTGMPARVVYGDYVPADYAWKRNRIGVDRYQNAWWPSVGSLVALGLLHAGDVPLARAILIRIGQTASTQGDFHEWYDADGTPEGAPHFQWAARMYLIAVLALAHTAHGVA